MLEARIDSSVLKILKPLVALSWIPHQQTKATLFYSTKHVLSLLCGSPYIFHSHIMAERESSLFLFSQIISVLIAASSS